MKQLFSLSMMLIFCISFSNAQTTKSKKYPSGEWKFEALYAPEGYTSGNISIGLAEKKYTATISIPGTDYKFTCENVKFVNDSLIFSVNLEDQTVNVKMKMEEASKMTGIAISTQGNIPLTATRQVN